MKKLIGVL